MSSPHKKSVVDAIVSAFETTQNQSWSMFNDKLSNVSNKNSKNRDNKNIKNMAKSDNSITLTSDDLPVFGLVPRLDKVMLVSCYECAMIVKRDCIHSHFYRRHNDNVVNHSEADKFSLVNFLSTVNTNKNKKPKMTVKKPPEKKTNEREKVNTTVKRIKTEFNQAEYDRLKTNGAEIKEENTTEYANENDVDMVTTDFKPNTNSSGGFEWDVKSCIKHEVHQTDHKLNEEMIKHDNNDLNKLSSVSLGIKEDIQSDKHLDIQKNEHIINYMTGSSQLLQALDPIEKINKITIDVSDIISDGEEKYLKKYYYAKKKYQKYIPHRKRNIKEQTKLTIKNEFLDIITNKNVDVASTSYNRWLNTPAVDVKYDSEVPCCELFSGLQNDGEQTKLFPCYEYLDVKNDIPRYSATNQSTESPKIKEEFQILPNNMFPDVKIKEEFQILPNNMFPDIKIKEEYDDKYNVELHQSPLTECSSGNNHSELKECSSDNNHSEVINNTDSANFVNNNNHSSIVPCCGTIKEEITFTEGNENIIMNNENSEDTVPNNRWSTALLDINEESKPALITDCVNEKSKPSLNTVFINDDSFSKHYQIYTNDFCPKLSPNLKYEVDKHLNHELDSLGKNSLSNDFEENSNNQLDLLVEDDLNVALNLQVEDDSDVALNLQIEEDLINKLDVQIEEDNMKHLQGTQIGGGGYLNDQFKVWDEEDSLDEECLNEEVSLSDDDDYLSDDLDWESEDGLISQEAENLINRVSNVLAKNKFGIKFNSQGENNVQSEDNLSDVENLSDEEDMSDEEDLNDRKNVSGDDLETNDDLECNYQVPYQLTNNEEGKKAVKIKKNSVIMNNESSNAASTDYDQSLAETLGNEEESNAELTQYKTNVIINNYDVANNFDNEYYQSLLELYDNKTLTSFTSSYKYSNVINNEDSDDSISSYDQSSVESLDISDKTDHSSSDNSSDCTSDESSYDSDSTTSNQSILQDVEKSINNKKFAGHLSKFVESFEFVNGKNNSSQTHVSFECTNFYTTTKDFIDNTQIDEHIDSIPNNSNVQMDGYDVRSFTPISSSAQIINNTIIPMNVEEYELKDSNDCSCYVTNRLHNLSHAHPHTCNPESQIDNLTHSPINENNTKLYSADIYAYKPIEYILPFIKKNNEVCKNHMKMIDKKYVKERKCKIMPYNRTAKNFQTNLKRQAADGKENLSHLITNGFKKIKMVFIDRDFSCSDDSDNNVDD